MEIDIHTGRGKATINLSEGIDISLPLLPDQTRSAWQLSPPEITPVQQNQWIGRVALGAAVNFNDLRFNPHAHLTHTECIGHITHDFYSVNQLPDMHRFFSAQLISLAPEKCREGQGITVSQIKDRLTGRIPEALIIRTLPNDSEKKTKDYFGSKPPFLTEEAANFLAAVGIRHLLVDLPSIDPENDQGQLLAHKAFWQITDVRSPGPHARYTATVTELIFVPDAVKDGFYWLQFGLMPAENDAAPSRPVLFIEKEC